MKWLIAALLLWPAAAWAQYLDGLPPASALSSGDVAVVCQGGTPGVPGTCATRKTTVGAFASTAVGNGLPSVTAFGAKCDGTTDDTAAIAAALFSGSAAIPAATCYSATGIVVPDNRTLAGLVYGPGSQNTAPSGSIILCPAALTTACVNLGNNDNNSSAINNLTITRSGTPGTTAPCLNVSSGENVYISQVECFNHAQGFETSSGIYIHFNDVLTCKISDSHIVINATPGVYFKGGVIGCVGSYDVPGNNYVKIAGNWDAAVGTVHFVDTQFNLGVNQVTCGLDFAGFTGTTNIVFDIEIIGGHLEQANSFLCSDATVKGISYLQINGLWAAGSLHGANALFSLNSATSVLSWELDGDHFTGWTTASLAPATSMDDLKITGTSFADTPLSITGNGANSQIQLTGNTYQGLTLAGAFGFGSIVQGIPRPYGGSGSYSYSFSGPLQIEIPDFSNYNNSSAIALKFGSSAAITSTLFGEYQFQGSSVTQSVSFTLNGTQPTGNATITNLPLTSSGMSPIGLSPLYCSGITSGPIYAAVEGGTTTVQFVTNGTGGVGTATNTNFGSGSPTCTFIVTYMVE